MKHGSNQRRGRSRGGSGGKRHQSSRNQALDSNGPEGKVRGSAQQIFDKYTSLARDAASAGEHITAEGFYQFAEHYYRLANADGANNQNQNRSQQDAQPKDEQANEGAVSAEGVAPAQAENADAETTKEEKPRRRRNLRKASADSNEDDAPNGNKEAEAEVETEVVADSNDAEAPQSDSNEPSDDTELAASA